MQQRDHLDFWYAVNNTEIVLMPKRHLETFGTTILRYHLVSALMDVTDQVRIREGRMHANQPQIITPEAYAQTLLEGFGEEATKYAEWLTKHDEIRILQYGYKLRQESFSEHVVTGDIKTIVERVEKEVKDKGDPLSTVVLGVDDPWDVCLVKLFYEVMRESAKTNITELQSRHMLDTAEDRQSRKRAEIENEFLLASRDSSRINTLGKKLQDAGWFSEYEDRFFALVKASKT